MRERLLEIEWLEVELAERLIGFAAPLDLPRSLAVAALVRCWSCLKGIGVLLHSGADDLVGLLVRNAWESWLVGVYAALGGNAAAEVLVGDHRKRSRIQSERWKSTLDPIDGLETWPERDLNFEQVAQQVKTLLSALPRSPLVNAQLFYDVLYRTESMAGAHANLGLLVRYLESRDGRVAVRLPPHGGTDDGSVEEMVALYLAHLAGIVFDAIDLPHDRVDALFDAMATNGP